MVVASFLGPSQLSVASSTVLEATESWAGPGNEASTISLVPRPSPAPVFDRLQYAKTEPEGLVNLTT